MNLVEVRDKLNEYIKLDMGDHPVEIRIKVEGEKLKSINFGEVDLVIQDTSFDNTESNEKRAIYIQPGQVTINREILESLNDYAT